MKTLSLDQRTKAIFFLLFTTSASFSKSLVLTLIYFIIILSVILFSNINWKNTFPFLVWFIVIALINIFSLFIFPNRDITIVSPCSLLEMSILSVLRLAVLTLSSIWLCLCFDHKKWDLVFHGLWFPDKLVLIAGLIPRYLSVLVHDFNSTKEAQQARGLEIERKNFFQYVSIVCSLLIPTFARAWSEVEDKINSIDMRGLSFSSKRSWCNTLQFRSIDYFAFSLMVAAFLASIFFNATLSLKC
jgi:energy-coupling factor transporter transmembrane protein EcfT